MKAGAEQIQGMDAKYRSRKFMITLGTIALTTALAYYKVMNGDVALVFAAAIASYNYSNMREAENG